MRIIGSSLLLVTAVLVGCSEAPTSPKSMSTPTLSAQCNNNTNNSNNPPQTAGNCGTTGGSTGNNPNNPPTTSGG